MQSEVDAQPRRDVAGLVETEATIEATSVAYERDGNPSVGIVTALTDDGRRVMANARDTDTLRDMTTSPWETAGSRSPTTARPTRSWRMTNHTLQPSRGLMLWRGCGASARAAGRATCSTVGSACGRLPALHLHFEREPGYWTGAVAINTAVIGIIFTIVMIVFSAATIPDIPWVTLLMIEVPIMGIGPIGFYPFSKTLWVAIDRAFLSAPLAPTRSASYGRGGRP